MGTQVGQLDFSFSSLGQAAGSMQQAEIVWRLLEALASSYCIWWLKVEGEELESLSPKVFN
jgi:hypothetical protein